MPNRRMIEAALRRLDRLAVAEHDPIVEEAYERSMFGHGWDDVDSDGQDERAEALIRANRDRRAPVEFATGRERRVVSGWWVCRFTGERFTDASDLDIDHLVPLKNAWLSGAHAWTDERRERYANGVGKWSDRKSWLVPVSASANRSKGDRSPDEWMPPRESYRARYAASWIRTKWYWGLSITAAERDALRAAL